MSKNTHQDDKIERFKRWLKAEHINAKDDSELSSDVRKIGVYQTFLKIYQEFIKMFNLKE